MCSSIGFIPARIWKVNINLITVSILSSNIKKIMSNNLKTQHVLNVTFNPLQRRGVAGASQIILYKLN